MSRRLSEAPVHALALVVLFCAAGSGLHAQTLQITSPADGTIVNPGQVVTVTVAASPASVFQEVIIVGGASIGFSQTLTAPPYEFSIQIPSDIRPRRYTLTADGTTVPGQGAASDPITLVVERSDNPVTLSTEPRLMRFHLAGDQCPLRVVGTFPDGSLVDVQESTYITYQSDAPGVATVDIDGHVAAVAPGSANIVATYAGVSATIPVTVAPSVTIVPVVASLYISRNKRFIAQLNLPPNLDQSVIWSTNPGLGSIDQTGLYTAPSSLSSWQTVTVTATSVADPTKSASATVYVFPPVSIAVAPLAASLSAGRTQDFIATVANGSKYVIWSITPDGVGTIYAHDAPNPDNPYVPYQGVTYYAPGLISSPQTVTVTATSVWDNSKKALSHVTLVPSVAVSVGPANAIVYAFQTLQFTATVNYGSDGTVSWSLNPNVGTISATGLYTAPAMVTHPQTVSVIATGPDIGAGPNSGVATVTLTPRISTSITAPTGLNASVVSNSEIDLSWSGSTEPGGTIAGYDVFHNGTWVGSTTGTSFADLGLIASTSYTYTVAAYDTIGNSSALSPSVTAATLVGNLPNLVAYYNFNEGAGTVLHDLSGKGNNGTIGTATWANPGKFGGALLFDGSNGSNVTVPSSASLNLGTGMTLEAWVNPAAGGCIYDRACGDVIMKYQEYDPAFDQTNLSYGLFIVNYIVGAASTTSGSQNSATGANDLPLNAWAHLATTYDGTSQRLYVNGALANDAVPLSGTLLAGTLPLFIGGGTIYDLRQFRGKIDEVRIYNRALSQTEILNDMVGAATPTLTSVSPTTGVQGTAVPVTLTGTNFVAGATVGVSNPGITVGSVTVVSATQITATFTIAANAAVGTANVTVTTSAGTSGTVAFIVNPPAPTLSTIAPTSGVQGAAVPVTLTGTNFVTGATVAVTNPGITVASVTVVGATQITATFTIAANAAPGPASVTVTTSGGTSAPATFTVVSAAEVISTPATPTGPVTGVSGTLYGFAASGSSSSLGHAVQYSFSWGDGTYSGWTPSGVTSSSHRWTAPGTYTVTVQARCTIDTAVTSSYSAGLAITITSESISVPTTPSGPGSVVTGTSYTYSTGGSVSSLGHQIHYLLIWGDGSISGWLPVGTTSASHTFFGPGTWVVIARAACTTDTQVFSPDSAAFTVSVLADKTISAPSAPSGPVTGSSGTSYTYSTGGAVSSTGSAVVYLFDWGDGKKSGWLAAGVTTAAHTWASPGSYAVTASAADATDVLIQSSASSALTVTMAAP